MLGMTMKRGMMTKFQAMKRKLQQILLPGYGLAAPESKSFVASGAL